MRTQFRDGFVESIRFDFTVKASEEGRCKRKRTSYKEWCGGAVVAGLCQN